jgi:hypothetical protein
MLRQAETPFKVLSIESKNRMVLVVRMKFVFDVIGDDNGVLKLRLSERVFDILTRRLENLDEILNEY